MARWTQSAPLVVQVNEPVSKGQAKADTDPVQKAQVLVKAITEPVPKAHVGGGQDIERGQKARVDTNPVLALVKAVIEDALAQAKVDTNPVLALVKAVIEAALAQVKVDTNPVLALVKAVTEAALAQ